MTHPISAFMLAVFVPVKDLKQATEWYSELLGRPIAAKEDEDGIYIFAMGAAQLILDGNAWGTPPRIMFATDDIDASHKVCEGLPHETLSDVFSDDYVSVFNINSLMICKANRDLGLPPQNTNVLLGKMNRIFVHTDSLADSVGWHEALLAKSAQPDLQFGELPSIRMDQGPHLLFDDNRLSQSQPVFYEQLQLDLRANPIAVIESPDLPAALEHVRSKGAVVDKGIESRFDIQFFIFYDPDGNGFLVCET
jgi:catechol 2,3-dioxygenase-like lactoylglutathione lyase family enzyme